MMIVSFLIPTRGRIQSLLKGIQSIKEKSSSDVQVEILVRIDEDDGETLANRDIIQGEIVVGPRWCGYECVYLFYNELAEKCHGDWIILWNDDAYMVSRNWDKLLPPPDRPQVIWLYSRSSWTWAFPAMTRKLYELWKCFTPANPADTVIFDLWTKAGKPIPDPNSHSNQIEVDHRRDEKQMMAMGLPRDKFVYPQKMPKYDIGNMIELLRNSP